MAVSSSAAASLSKPCSPRNIPIQMCILVSFGWSFSQSRVNAAPRPAIALASVSQPALRSSVTTEYASPVLVNFAASDNRATFARVFGSPPHLDWYISSPHVYRFTPSPDSDYMLSRKPSLHGSCHPQMSPQ